MKKAYFCFSAKTRKILLNVVKFVSLLMTILCVVYLGVVLYSLQFHRFILHDLIISLFDDLYKNLICLGVLTFMFSIVCFKVNRNLMNQPTNHSLSRTHRWTVALLLAIMLANVLCIYITVEVNAVVGAEVGPRLKHGLSRYLDTPSWGSALDHIQNYLRCCGVHGPSDWYATAWIPLDRLAGHNVDYKLVQPTGRVQVPLVPSSCCRVVSAECGHKAWMETKTRSWNDIKPADSSLLHMVGCEEAVKRRVAVDLLVFGLFMAVVFILQVVLLVALRLSYTSTSNSVKLGRPLDSAPGWIIGPGWVWGRKRFGYLQDCDDKCLQVDTGEPQEDANHHKKKWKCLEKIKCRKTGNESETESEGTHTTKSWKRRLNSPCVTKLKQAQCMAKLKKCSRKLRKKKNKDEGYLNIESETPVESESELNHERKSPERMRTGGDWYIGHRMSETSEISMNKKISSNLIDVEEAIQRNEENTELPKAGEQISPLSTKYSVNDKNGAKSPETASKQITNFLEPKKRVSVVVEDFKQKREWFENAAKTESQSESGMVETIKISIPPTVHHSVNLIDLDAVESTKSASMGGTSATDLAVKGSGKNGADVVTTVLRNYPPLPLSE